MSSLYRVRPSARLFRLPASLAVLPLLLFASPALSKELTLNAALAQAAGADPSVAVLSARLQAARAGIDQAGIRPRDTIGIDAEDFAGTGPYSPADRAQTTAWYERTWEMGGKRAARMGAARAELGVTTIGSRLRLLDLLSQVQTAWIEALAAEVAIPIAEQRLASAERVASETGRRVGRALDPLFAAERAKAGTAQARIARDQARENARATRATLASYWGGSTDFTLDPMAFGITGPSTVPAEDGPDITAATAERDAADARSRLARTGDAGDPTGRFGVRHIGEGNDVAFVMGGSIPLGSRAANRGNVARADAERQAADAEIALTRVQVRREIDRLGAERLSLVSEVTRIDAEVLPSAERAVRLVRDGYARGGTAFTFLEVSQAQGALAEARTRRVDLLRRYHLAGARLDRLTGRHLPLLIKSEAE